MEYGEEEGCKVVREGHEISNKAIGEAVCKNKYSSYCASDFDLEKDLMSKSRGDCLCRGPSQLTIEGGKEEAQEWALDTKKKTWKKEEKLAGS